MRLGKISGVQGVRGWLKVFSDTEPRERIFQYPRWILKQGETEREVSLVDWQRSGKKLVVRLAGIETRDQAELLTGSWIDIRSSDLDDLGADGFYWYQLEGLEAWVADQQGGCQILGNVDHLLETGANDVLVIRPTERSIDDRERLIPWSMEQVVIEVDLNQGRIQLDWDPEY